MRIYALTYFVAILIYKLRAMCDNVKLPAEDLILFIHILLCSINGSVKSFSTNDIFVCQGQVDRGSGTDRKENLCKSKKR